MLDHARAELSQNNGDVEETANRLQRMLDRGVADELAAETHFLYGTAQLRLAERASGSVAHDYWNRARDQLEEAERLGVAETDKAALQYRLGKVGYHLESDPAKVVERLAGSVGAADDRAEGLNLLTQAYLRLTPPNLQAALEANEQLRLLMAPEEVLERARLTGGEILLRMGQPGKAYQVLDIHPPAPAEILTKARMLRARSKQDEQEWRDAAALWLGVLADPSDAVPEKGLVRYNLGLCYRRIDTPQEAVPVWEECVQQNTGDERAAAALGLAELRLQDDKSDKALELLELALRNVRKPTDWDNKLLDRAQACEIFERGCRTARQSGHFHLALQMVTLYERIAAPGRALVMRGDILSDWGNKRRDEKTTLPPQSAEETGAQGLFKQAAEAYEQAAKQTADDPKNGDYLWLAVNRFLDAGEQVRAQGLLDQLFAMTPRPDARLGEGWFLVGECYRKEAQPGAADRADKLNAAEGAYHRCIAFQTPFAFSARLQLALFMIEQGNIDEAGKELQGSLTDMSSDEENEIKQRTRFTLIHLSYRAKKYKTVVENMERMLEHLPSTREAVQARYELAESYRHLADDEDRSLDGMTFKPEGQDLHTEIRDGLRKRAAEEYEKLVATDPLQELLQAGVKPTKEEYEKLVATDPLQGLLPGETATEANALDANARRRDVYYFAALMQFQLGDFDKSLAAYSRMAKRYRGEPDEWIATAGMVSSYTGKGDVNMVRSGLTEISRNLGNMTVETREVMERYILEVQKKLPPEKAPSSTTPSINLKPDIRNPK